MKQPIVLRLYLDGQLEAVKQYTESQIVIGKNNGLQLQLTGNYIAPLHAVIEERDNGHYISDLGSEHGVFVNNQKVLDHKIEPGDKISIGSYKIEFFVGVPESTAPAAPEIDNDHIQTTTSEPVQEEAKAEEKTQPPLPELPETPEPEESPAEPVKASEPKKDDTKVVEEPVEEDTKKIEVPELKKEEKRPPLTPAAVAAATQVASVGREIQTFAPPSQVENWLPILEPEKGTVLEVAVAWKERIISSHHFNNRKVVTIGSDESCDINVPLLGVNSAKYELLKVGPSTKVNVTQQMTGHHVDENKSVTPLRDLFSSGKIISGPKGNVLDLPVGEMVVLELEGGLLKLYIRYVPQSPKTAGAPIFDFTTAESTAIILATVVASIFSLYMMIYTPVDLSDENLIEEELVRKAKVTFQIPPRKKVVVKEKVEKPPEPKKEEKRKVVKVTDKVNSQKKKIAKSPTADKRKSGSAKALKKNPNLKKTNKKASSVQKGGSVKTSGKKNANMQAKEVDANKVGLLNVFGKGGLNKQLNKGSAGVDNGLIGAADRATGQGGLTDDRDGDSLGGKLKAGSGSGNSTVGIGGIKTGSGTGTGLSGTGSGGGLGEKGRAQLEVGGAEEEFIGSIDKEAIRRVIRRNRRAIKACYELALNRNKNLYGKLVLKWSIIEKGKAIKASVVSNTLNDREVANCIKRKLVTWRFPEPPANTEAVVTFPFVFSSQ